MNEGKEYSLKNQPSDRFYIVTNIVLANEIIKLGKYIYFTE